MSTVLSLCQFTRSTVGRKTLVALSGLGLSGFTLMHMSGNLLLLVGAEPYNKYSHSLISNPLIYFAEVGLVVLFLLHFGLAIRLTLQNRCARPEGYRESQREKGTTFAARTMIYSGLLLLVFLVLHLITFKFGEHYSVTYQGVEMRDLHRLVVEKFQSPLYVGWYLFSLVVLGLHLSHGLAASLQSLGLASSVNCKVRKLGYLVAGIIMVGFMVQPIVLMWKGVS